MNTINYGIRQFAGRLACPELAEGDELGTVLSSSRFNEFCILT